MSGAFLLLLDSRDPSPTDVTAGQGISDAERVFLDDLDLNDAYAVDGGDYLLEDAQFPAPRKKPEWVSGADQDGASLLRDPLLDNRTVTLRVRITEQENRDAALELIGAIIDRLEEAERNDDGVDLVWIPAGASHAITLKALTGELDELPVTHESGYFALSPVVTVTLTCLPAGVGTEQLFPAAPATGTQYLTVTLADIPGDLPADGRLIFTDTSATSRRYLEWGLEQRHLNAATSLVLDSAALNTSGYGSGSTTRNGVAVIRQLLESYPMAICATGQQDHVGVFRVKARIYAENDKVRVRLRWQDGDGPYQANPWAAPPQPTDFNEVDLGLITISPASLGTQRWQGVLEGYLTSGGSVNVDIASLILVPAGEGYGRARAAWSYRPGVTRIRDQFTSTTAGTGLGGRVAPQGGTWGGGGVATDFEFADGPDGGETVSRSTAVSEAAPRVNEIGTAVTDTEMFARVRLPGEGFRSGVMVRHGSTSNYLAMFIRIDEPWTLRSVIGGSATDEWSTDAFRPLADTWYGLRLIAYASGRVIGMITDAAGAILAVKEATVAAVRTGGALASGQVGLYDQNLSTNAGTRYYDDVFAYAPAPEPIVCYASQSVEIRTNTAVREDATGATAGNVPSYRGAPFRVPPAGVRGRDSRLLVKAHRDDIETGSDEATSLTGSVQVAVTPRYYEIPR